MRSIKKIIAGSIVAMACVSSAIAQTTEDALRFMEPNVATSARSSAFGTSFYGLLDESSAMLYNPAGLTLVRFNEFSLGLSTESSNTTSNFFGNSRKSTLGDDNLTHATFLSSFKIDNKNAAFALGYNLESNFNDFTRYSAVNPNSSYVKYQTLRGPFDIPVDNFGYYLWLTDTLNFYTPLANGMNQDAKVTESGGIHSFTGAFAMDVSQNLSIGFGLSGKWGTYKYVRQYIEADINHLYEVQTPDYSNVDFDSVIATEKNTQDLSGITGNVGLMFHEGNNFRMSLGIKFPTFYSIESTDEIEAISVFDDNSMVSNPPYHYTRKNSYKLRTPFVYSLGASYSFKGATLTGGLEYSDASQTEFSDLSTDQEKVNTAISENFCRKLSWGIGAQYDIPLVPVSVFGSYGQSDVPMNDAYYATKTKTIAFGAGYDFSEGFRLSAAYRLTKYDMNKLNYGSEIFKAQREISNFQIQLSYRFEPK